MATPDVPKFTGKSIAAPKANYQTVHPETGMSVPKPTTRVDTAMGAIDVPEGVVPPPNMFSGQVKNFDVFPNKMKYPEATAEKPIPGHELYWFHDDNGGQAIALAQASGWVLVEKDEVGLTGAPISPGNTANDNYVRKWTKGATPQGVPIYAILMKKPQWLYDLHAAEREAVHQRQEAMLRHGVNPARPNDTDANRRVASSGIQIDTSLKASR